MKREVEIRDIKTLERELLNQHFRYRLAIKDGAVDSVMSEVIFRIAYLEDRIQQLKNEKESELSYSLHKLEF